MGTPKTTIELNGKRYDARTGKIISDEPGPAIASTPQPKPAQTHSGQILDGFVRRPTRSLKPAKTNVNNTERKPEKSKTLMRPAVKKPAVIKNDIQPTKRTPRVEPSQIARASRAETAEKSPLISRFNNATHSNISKKTGHLPVVSVAGAKAQLQAVESSSAKQLKQFEDAINNATSHLKELEKGTVKKSKLLNRIGFRNRAVNLASLSLAVLVLGGFFAYQNAPAIEMRVAASRSGVSARLPGYKPTGYGVAGNVKSEPGKVSVSFKSRSDSDKTFTISQQTSNWTSASLLANQFASTNQQYQTFDNDGKTVYIYDNSNATWVDKGIWYKVEGNASLTSDQLLKISSSL